MKKADDELDAADAARISIHVPRVEDDSESKYEKIYRLAFQSTSPVWRTTVAGLRLAADESFQSTSPVWRTTRATLSA